MHSSPSRRWRPVCAVMAEHTAHQIATEHTELTAGAGHRNDPPVQPFPNRNRSRAQRSELATILETNR